MLKPLRNVREMSSATYTIKKKVFIIVSLYIIVLSLLPLINDILSLGRWSGYGWGAYRFDNGIVAVRFSELMYGADKPKICIYPSHYLIPLPPCIDVVEVSDHESYINGDNIHYDCNVTSIRIVNDTTITFNYSCKNGIHFNKTVNVQHNNIVVSFESSNNTYFKISLWRWYYNSINNVTVYSMGKATSLDLGEVESLTFTFLDRTFGEFESKVLFNAPVHVSIYRDEKGLNKFVFEILSRNVNLIISVRPGSNSSDTIGCVGRICTNVIFEAIKDVKALHLLYPVVALACILLVWFKWVKG
jgi:hypothetical protein